MPVSHDLIKEGQLMRLNESEVTRLSRKQQIFLTVNFNERLAKFQSSLNGLLATRHKLPMSRRGKWRETFDGSFDGKCVKIIIKLRKKRFLISTLMIIHAPYLI